MRDSLIDKINGEIATGVEKEGQVVYVMVELRKILDRMRLTGNDKFGIIRFYSDWVVHTSKNRVTPEIKKIIDRIDSEIPIDYRKNKLWAVNLKESISFIYMESLKKGLEDLFAETGIDNSLLEKNNWTKFISLLVKILEEQPITNPNDNIESFLFEPTASSAVVWVINFKDARGSMRFGNIY